MALTESQFLNYSDRLFAYIETTIDHAAPELDVQISGNVLTVGDDDGHEIVVNRHLPNQELWIASRQGGHHFQARDGQWISARDGTDFFERLNEALNALADNPVALKPFQAA